MFSSPPCDFPFGRANHKMTGLMLRKFGDEFPATGTAHIGHYTPQLEQLEKMTRVSRGDRFLALLDLNRKILFKVAHLYCRNSADLADVVQEIVLQAWRSFDQYDDSRPFSTWLYRVALNVAISFYRGEARRSRTMVPADE